MSVLRPRNRLVNFRVSEDEFEKLKASCEQFGARSVSDFARSSVLNRMEQGAQGGDSGSGKLSTLDLKVTGLEARMEELVRLLEATGQTAHGASEAELVAQELTRSATP
jgi:hypothetical protein